MRLENTKSFPDVPLARNEDILIEEHRVFLSSVWTNPSLCLPLGQSSWQSGIKVVKLPSTSQPIVSSLTSPSISTLVTQAPLLQFSFLNSSLAPASPWPLREGAEPQACSLPPGCTVETSGDFPTNGHLPTSHDIPTSYHCPSDNHPS